MGTSVLDNAAVAREFIRFLLTFSSSTKKRAGDYPVRNNSRAIDTLFILKQREGPLTMSVLADSLSMSKQQFTKLVNQMEEQQLVHRIRDPHNRRQVYIAIAPAGETLANTVLEETAGELAKDMAVYTGEEKQEFLQCLSTFRRLLNKMQADPSPRGTRTPPAQRKEETV